MINKEAKKTNRVSTVIAFLTLSLTSSYLMASDSMNLDSTVSKEIHSKLSSYPDAVRQSASNKELVINNTANLSITRRSQARKKRPAEILKQSSAKIRDAQPQKSASAFGFGFYSANSYFNADLDGDGYFSDFSIEFDADFDDGFADVYAVIYYSQNGGDWMELSVTDVFTIFSDDAGDFYSLDLILNSGFPTNEYDILIDLYEDGVTGIVATISSDDTDELYALPLEDEEHELSSNNVLIGFVASDLFGDLDGDGFYTDLTLEYDIDTLYVGDTVYAEIVLTNVDDGWRQIVSSGDFILGNQTEFIDLGFNSGYTPGWYDVEINLINSFTGEEIADAAQEFSSLRSLPIESANFDDPAADVSSGSFSWSIILLGLLGLRRRVLR